MLYLMVVNDYQILYKLLVLFGGRCEIRTHGTWLRRPVIYPTELIAHAWASTTSGHNLQRIKKQKYPFASAAE